MAEQLKERKDIESSYLWDLTPIYESDEAWEKAFAQTESLAARFASYPGTLGQSPEHLREFYDLMYSAFETLERLNGYAFQRKSEDNRQDAAQSMYSRSVTRYVQLASAVSFVDPEILALPEDRRPETTLLYGAQTMARFSCVPDFKALGANVKLATEDGSFGAKGFVTDLLPEVLPEDFPAQDAQILACGPMPMLRAVAKWSAARGIECWTSLESPMACGMGLCFSCVVEWKNDDGKWDYKRACVDGPVFDAARLKWD